MFSSHTKSVKGKKKEIKLFYSTFIKKWLQFIIQYKLFKRAEVADVNKRRFFLYRVTLSKLYLKYSRALKNSQTTAEVKW